MRLMWFVRHLRLWQEIIDSEEVISNIANVALEHIEVVLGRFTVYFPVYALHHGPHRCIFAPHRGPAIAIHLAFAATLSPLTFSPLALSPLALQGTSSPKGFLPTEN